MVKVAQAFVGGQAVDLCTVGAYVQLLIAALLALAPQSSRHRIAIIVKNEARVAAAPWSMLRRRL